MGNMIYGVAKYVPNLLRMEPRNIGVIVADESGATLRLLGLGEECAIDLRILRRVRGLQDDGTAYTEWARFWMREVGAYNASAVRDADLFVRSLADAGGDVLAVHYGGWYIPEEDAESAESVAAHLFAELVSAREEPAVNEPASAVTRTLYTEVHKTFKKLGLLAPTPKAAGENPHLIRMNAPVPGTLPVPHRPKFSQLNGKLAVMEHMDFGAAGEEKVTHHALSTAYMFGDIRDANRIVPPDLIVIVHWSHDRNMYAQEVGKAALLNVEGTRMVNWDNAWERDRFLRERQDAAQHLS
jgi:hypothetical protein